MANEELIRAAEPIPGGSPSWADLLPLLLEVATEDAVGDTAASDRAHEMLRRMARAADAWNDHINGA